MSQDRDPIQDAAADAERREALIKLGKYVAYATPVVLASVSAAHGQAPISGLAPPPPPGPPTTPSDARLKTGLVRIGSHPAGFGIYRFRYLGSEAEYVGVIAQEVLQSIPSAVSASPAGILSVDYGALGMEMTRFDG